MSKSKSDITKYSPSLGGTIYNETILKLLAIEGPMTIPSMANKIFERKMVPRKLIEQYARYTDKAKQYYAKKKLNSILDRRLHALQGESENPKYVEAEQVQKGKKTVNVWGLTCRGYILSIIAIEEARRKWQVCYDHYRNKTPDHWREVIDKLIEHKVSNNLYNLLCVKPLQTSLKGKLDIIGIDEIWKKAVFTQILSFDKILEFVVSGKVIKTRNIGGFVSGFLHLSKEDKDSFFRVCKDKEFRNSITEATNDLLRIEKKKAELFEQIIRRFKDF